MKDPERTSFLNKAKKISFHARRHRTHTSLLPPLFHHGHCLSHHHNEDFICRLEHSACAHNAAAEYSAGAAGITAVFLSDQKNRLFMQSGRDCLIFFAVVDRVKVSMRQEPLLPTDLTLAKEVIAILKTSPFISWC